MPLISTLGIDLFLCAPKFNIGLGVFRGGSSGLSVDLGDTWNVTKVL